MAIVVVIASPELEVLELGSWPFLKLETTSISPKSYNHWKQGKDGGDVPVLTVKSVCRGKVNQTPLLAWNKVAHPSRMLSPLSDDTPGPCWPSGWSTLET